MCWRLPHLIYKLAAVWLYSYFLTTKARWFPPCCQPVWQIIATGYVLQWQQFQKLKHSRIIMFSVQALAYKNKAKTHCSAHIFILISATFRAKARVLFMVKHSLPRQGHNIKANHFFNAISSRSQVHYFITMRLQSLFSCDNEIIDHGKPLHKSGLWHRGTALYGGFGSFKANRVNLSWTFAICCKNVFPCDVIWGYLHYG